jgi:hypothetical protein
MIDERSYVRAPATAQRPGMRPVLERFLEPGPGEPASSVDPWLPRIAVTEVAGLSEVAADAVLVRPDGYVCWVAGEDGSREESLHRLSAALSHWFGA